MIAAEVAEPARKERPVTQLREPPCPPGKGETDGLETCRRKSHKLAALLCVVAEVGEVAHGQDESLFGAGHSHLNRLARRQSLELAQLVENMVQILAGSFRMLVLLNAI